MPHTIASDARAACDRDKALSKTYGGNVRALIDLDLRVGEVGSWLSRAERCQEIPTIRLLLGLIRATAGRALCWDSFATRWPSAAPELLRATSDSRIASRVTSSSGSLARLHDRVDETLRETCASVWASSSTGDPPSHGESTEDRNRPGVHAPT